MRFNQSIKQKVMIIKRNRKIGNTAITATDQPRVEMRR